jgi:hypothetical protein
LIADQRSPGQSTKEKVQKGEISEKSFSNIFKPKGEKRRIFQVTDSDFMWQKIGKIVHIFLGKIRFSERLKQNS